MKTEICTCMYSFLYTCTYKNSMNVLLIYSKWLWLIYMLYVIHWLLIQRSTNVFDNQCLPVTQRSPNLRCTVRKLRIFFQPCFCLLNYFLGINSVLTVFLPYICPNTIGTLDVLFSITFTMVYCLWCLCLIAYKITLLTVIYIDLSEFWFLFLTIRLTLCFLLIDFLLLAYKSKEWKIYNKKLFDLI